MKEVYAITQNQDNALVEFKHVIFGIDKNDLRSATMQTEARKKINWHRDFTWGLLCTEETYEYIKEHLVFGGFDPYEIEDEREARLREMIDMHFYKEVGMI
jgi:hypothetical protein